MLFYPKGLEVDELKDFGEVYVITTHNTTRHSDYVPKIPGV